MAARRRAPQRAPGRARRQGAAAASQYRPALGQRVGEEMPGDELVGLVHRIGAVEDLHVLGVDGPVADQRLEIDDLVPVAGAEEDDRQVLLHLARLPQRQYLEQLVERAEAARKDDERLREVGEPELAHEEI